MLPTRTPNFLTNAKYITNVCIDYAYVQTHKQTHSTLQSVFMQVFVLLCVFGATLGGVLMSLVNQPIRPLKQNPAVIGWLDAMALCQWERNRAAERCSSCKHLTFSLWGFFLFLLILLLFFFSPMFTTNRLISIIFSYFRLLLNSAQLRRSLHLFWLVWSSPLSCSILRV